MRIRNNSARPLNRRMVLKAAAGASALSVAAASMPPTALAMAADADTRQMSNAGGLNVGDRVRVRTDDGSLLNLRQHAGTGAAIVGTIANGQDVTVVGGPIVAGDGNWYQLQTANATGWATARYLIVDFRIGDPVETTDALNLRSGATTGSAVIAVLPAGMVGTVVGGPEVGNAYTWWQIKTGFGTGWAVQDFLALTASATSPPPPPSSSANLRAAATSTANSTTSVTDNVFDLSQPPYSADLTGNTDMTAVLQGAMNDAAAFGYGAILRIPYGRLQFADTLIWRYGVMLEGGWGSGDHAGASQARWPYLLWKGLSSKNAVETDPSVPPNWTWDSFRRLNLIAAAGYAFKSGIVFQTRCDSSTHSDFQIAGATDYAIEFQGGGINVALTDWRTDNIGVASIRWVLAGLDSLTLERFTTDNWVLGGSSGGTLVLDGKTAVNTSRFQLGVRAGKLETNKNLAQGTGHFQFNINPSNTTPPAVSADFHRVWEAANPNVTNHDGIVVNPANDRQVVLQMDGDSNLSVIGVPQYVNAVSAQNKVHPLTVISPFTKQIAASPGANWREVTFVSEVNVVGSLKHHGKKAAPIAYFTTSELFGVTIYAGDLLCDPATRVNGHRVVRECIMEGTLGTLSDVIGDMTAGTNTMTVNTIAGLKLGQWVNVGGPDNKRILDINGLTNVVTLHSNVSATRTAQAITFVAPAFRNGQFIPITGSKPWTPAANQATGTVQTTMVGAPGAQVGDMVHVGFSTALPAGCFLVGNVASTNGVSVTLVNLSGSPQTVSSGTLRVQVFSQ